MEKYSIEEMETIVLRYEKIQENRKKRAPATKEQKKIWNAKYYETYKKERRIKANINYHDNKEKIKERQKFYYYKGRDNLGALKNKYPEIYEKFMIH